MKFCRFISIEVKLVYSKGNKYPSDEIILNCCPSDDYISLVSIQRQTLSSVFAKSK